MSFKVIMGLKYVMPPAKAVALNVKHKSKVSKTSQLLMSDFVNGGER